MCSWKCKDSLWIQKVSVSSTVKLLAFAENYRGLGGNRHGLNCSENDSVPKTTFCMCPVHSYDGVVVP